MGHGELSEKAAGFAGPWWMFPPLRNALLAGVLAGVAFLLEFAGSLPESIATWAYVTAIPLGGWHWIREGLEELVEHGEVGIEVLIAVPWLIGLPLEFWARRAVVLLAAAPCALIMSMPMAMAAGIGGAGRRGILIKGGAHLEHLGVIKVVAFDKTGTLTLGNPAVTEVIPLDIEGRALLAAAAGLEHYSQHPLARAIVEAAKERRVAPTTAQDFRSLTGAGAQAVIDGAVWTIGSPTWFASQGSALAAHETRIAELQSQGKTVVLRGDNRHTAEAIARSLGIDDVRADLKPADKVAAVKQLQLEYGPVLMVGDGVNDAPALAAATCGAAMGVAGTDAALEAADLALMKDDLMKVVEALARGRHARRISLQNIVFSIAILAAMIPLAVLGVIGVTVAVLVHEAAELLAVANGARAGSPQWPGGT